MIDVRTAHLVESLRIAFRKYRYGAGEYNPDFDLFDAAADKIEELLMEHERKLTRLESRIKALEDRRS